MEGEGGEGVRMDAGTSRGWLGYGHMVIKSRAGCLGLRGEVLSCI